MVSMALLSAVSYAATDKVLASLRGTIGYQTAPDGAFTRVVGKYLLPDDYFAITREKSAALLTLPDSSLVGLGQNTRVQVGAFNQTEAGPGATITVDDGALRFDIRRPQGATANYHFATPTTQIAVRGTVGLLSLIGGNTTVACVVCAADSVTVTVGTQTFTLLTGQVLVVSAAGVAVAGTLSASVLSGFASAGVSTSASVGVGAATAGVVGGAAIPAAAVGGAAAAGAAAAIVSSSNPSANTNTTATPVPAASCNSTPVPIQVQGIRQSLATCPTPVPVQVQSKPAVPPTIQGGQRRAP